MESLGFFPIENILNYIKLYSISYFMLWDFTANKRKENDLGKTNLNNITNGYQWI